MIWIMGGIFLFLFVSFGFNWYTILAAGAVTYFLCNGLGGTERQCQRFVTYTKKKSNGIKS